MIIRADEGGLTLIRQTEHARLCGDMARAWGIDGFEPVQPLEAVTWAAAEHDNGWAEWEDTPQLNPRTVGLTHTSISPSTSTKRSTAVASPARSRGTHMPASW